MDAAWRFATRSLFLRFYGFSETRRLSRFPYLFGVTAINSLVGVEARVGMYSEHLSLYTGDRERDRSSSRVTDPSLVTRFVRSCTPVTRAGMHVARGKARSAKGRGAGAEGERDFLPRGRGGRRRLLFAG